MVTILKEWTGKKTETPPEKKEAHKERKAKKVIMNTLQQEEWKKELKDYESKSI